MGNEVLRFEGVNLWRGKKKILIDINWSIEQGQKWVVLGPNGAGKTSLLSMTTGYLFPSNGEVHILGKQLGNFNIARQRREIGYLSSALLAQLPLYLRAIDVVMTAKYGALNPAWHTYSKADHKHAKELLEHVGCGHLTQQEFQNCSSGERKRIALARTLMTDPQILILDEPATKLDLGGREELTTTLSQLDENLTCILVTHYVEEIPPNFTNLVLLADGAILAQGEIAANLTTQNLSTCFGAKLEVKNNNGRWSVQIK